MFTFLNAASIEPVSYSLTPHMAGICPDRNAWASSRWLVLIDAGQQPGLSERILRQIQPERSAWLYKDTFAENVLHLSPLLIELDANPANGLEDIKRLDALCARWPIMSVIQTQDTVKHGLTHLRTLLRIEMEGTPYLWRLADTQMLHATVSVLNPEQRTMLLGACEAWWMATDEGIACNLAAGHISPALHTEPLKLDGAQAHALLSATVAAALSSQLRTLAPNFMGGLSHIEQSRFARACVDEAREACLDEDAELLDWALQRWHEHASLATAAAASQRQA